MPRFLPARYWRFALGAVLSLLLPLAALAPAATPPAAAARDAALRRALDRILAGPATAGGFWGVYVYSLDRHRVLYDHNGEHWFAPASNAKLFTLAAALDLLGSDFRFHTVVTAAAAPDAAGTIAGNLVLRGDGDPSLGGRPYPYRPEPASPQLPLDPLVVPTALARQLQARGVTHITGDIVGDASYFSDDPYPEGWAIDDRTWDYGAPVSALTLNDNTRFLTIAPGLAPGAAPRLVFAPALDAPAVDNQATTAPAGAATELRLQQDPHGPGLILRGHIAADSSGDLEVLAVRHPALLAAALLRQALLAQGITVDGSARARLAPDATAAAPAYELAHWDSPPLSEILQTTAKLSQNLEAELMLRQLGKLRGALGAGQSENVAAIAVRTQFLHTAGLGATDTALVDGSGLSRLDLVTPAGVARLLEYMNGRPEAATWRALLPVAGVDGTLQHRFVGTVAADRVRAKTGSLTHVNSLSGYLTTRGGEHLAFSLLSNNDDHPAATGRAQLDRLVLALMQ